MHFRWIILCAVVCITAAAYGDGEILLDDALNGKGTASWKTAPAPFIKHPEYGSVYHFQTAKSATPSCGAWAGDDSWTSYRVEFEVASAGDGGGFFGLDFHVRDDGFTSNNLGFYIPKQDGQIAFESAARWGDNTSWKLFPYSKPIDYKKGRWYKLRLDVGSEVANLYVDGASEPIYSMHGLPFSKGGIRFWEYHLSVYLRNLRVTALPEGSVKPVLPDPWAPVFNTNVLYNWRVSCKWASEHATETLLQAILNQTSSWRDTVTDRRGVVNLIAEHSDDIGPGAAFAKTIIESDKREKRKAWVTYTDRITVWCNGEQVFKGEPRGFYDPGRSAEDGFGRLIPNQFEIELPLVRGENAITVRSQVTEPLWGWAFWMRVEK